MVAQSIVTNLPQAYIPPCISIEKKKNKTLRDWWAASPMSWQLLCVSLVPQEDLVEEPSQGWNEEQELSTLKVWSPLFFWDKTVASLLSFLFSWMQL